MGPRYAILALWIVFLLSWIVAARWSSPAAKRPATGSQYLYRALQAIGVVMLSIPIRHDSGLLRLWHIGWTGGWICALMVALGLAFTWWARVHLGRLWSSGVTRKADHRVVDTGPYGIVRHPIYTGILFALLATSVANGTVLGLSGFAIFTLGMWLKARLEEQWLSMELGEKVYHDYRQRVPMLVPYGSRRAG